MFQIKNLNSIVASMINRVSAGSSGLTDFNPGSVVRTILEATAVEIDEYYQALLKGFYEAVPVSIYKAFSFGRLPAVAASGHVTFTRETGFAGTIQIPAGTRVAIPGRSFHYIVSGTITMAAGQNTVDALVFASTTGADTNCLAGSISQLVDEIAGIASVTNTAALFNGQDEETDSERKLRFQQWLNTLARSTKESIYYGAMTVQLTNESRVVTERVVRALVHEPCIDDDPPGDPGLIDVYVWNGVNGAGNDLIHEVHKILYGYTDESGQKVPGWKAAGVIVGVYAVVPDLINVAMVVDLDGSRTEAEVDADIRAAIEKYFSTLNIGGEFVWSKLLQIVMDIEGVADVDITAPADNVAASDWNRICAPGTVTLTFS